MFYDFRLHFFHLPEQNQEATQPADRLSGKSLITLKPLLSDSYWMCKATLNQVSCRRWSTRLKRLNRWLEMTARALTSSIVIPIRHPAIGFEAIGHVAETIAAERQALIGQSGSGVFVRWLGAVESWVAVRLSLSKRNIAGIDGEE